MIPDSGALDGSDRWSALALTAAAVLLSLTTWFSATAVLPDLTELRDLSPTEAAWLTNAVQLGFAVGALGSSLVALADIIPLRRVMAAAAILAALANAALLIDAGTASMLLARFMTGVGLAGVYPPAMKFIATWFRRGRGVALGTMVGALTLGSALPHFVRGAGAGLADWHAVVIFCSLASAASALIFLLFLREGPYPFASAHVSIAQIGRVLGNRPAMLANVGYFGHMWELYAVWGWFLAYASQSGALGLLDASLLTFMMVAAGAPGCLVGGWLADRIGRCRTTILMLVVSGTSAMSIGLVFDGPTWLFITIALIWGFSVVADSAQFSAAVTELSDADIVGSSLAFQMGAGFSLTMVSIWLTPLIAEALGSWRWAFLVLVPGPIVGIWAMAMLYRHPRAAAMSDGRR